MQHLDGGQRAIFSAGPALSFDFRTRPLLNHPLVMFACLPHVHTQWSKAPQPVWCLSVCTGSVGRVSTLPQRHLRSAGLVLSSPKEGVHLGILRYSAVVKRYFTTKFVLFFLKPMDKSLKGTKISKSAVISVSRKYLLHPVAAPRAFSSHS